MKRFFLCASAFYFGCAHAPVAQNAAPPIQVNGPFQPAILVQRPDGKVVPGDVSSLFAHAKKSFDAKNFVDALSDYQLILDSYPQSNFVLPSLYNAGLTLEALGNKRGAAEKYRLLRERLKTKPGCDDRAACDDMLDALFRNAQVLGELQDYANQVALYDELLNLRGVTLQDRLEAQTRKGVALIADKKLIEADALLREELAYYREHKNEERLDTDFFIGMAAYYLADISHAYYRVLPVRTPTGNLAVAAYEKQLMVDLEAKARLVLKAQAEYLDAIRVRNPEWATAAGFQIGSLYREFYDDLVNAPVPPSLNDEEKNIYVEEVKKKVHNLLFKAVHTHERNLMMAERTGVKNEWVTRSNEQLDQLRQLLLPGSPLNPMPTNVNAATTTTTTLIPTAPTPPPINPPPLPTAPARNAPERP